MGPPSGFPNLSHIQNTSGLLPTCENPEPNTQRKYATEQLGKNISIRYPNRDTYLHTCIYNDNNNNNKYNNDYNNDNDNDNKNNNNN